MHLFIADHDENHILLKQSGRVFDKLPWQTEQTTYMSIFKSEQAADLVQNTVQCGCALLSHKHS